MPITVSSPLPTFQGNTTRKTKQNQPTTLITAKQPSPQDHFQPLFAGRTKNIKAVENELQQAAGEGRILYWWSTKALLKKLGFKPEGGKLKGPNGMEARLERNEGSPRPRANLYLQQKGHEDITLRISPENR